MLLSAEHLSINFGMRQLLSDVNFYLEEGKKAGIIGINGTGKSTFLKVLAGVIEPDAGRITRSPNVQISYLPQNPVMEDSATVLEQVFLHFPKEFRELSEYEAKTMLTKLGLSDFDQKVGTLSGGQRKRVALVSALVHPADSASALLWWPLWCALRIFLSWTSLLTTWTAKWWPGWRTGSVPSGAAL